MQTDYRQHTMQSPTDELYVMAGSWGSGKDIISAENHSPGFLKQHVKEWPNVAIAIWKVKAMKKPGLFKEQIEAI